MNPGTWNGNDPGRATQERLGEKLGVELGETLASIVRVMMITDACYAYGSPAPEFRWDSGLWVEFPFSTQVGEKAPVETREKTREKILRLVTENPVISMEEMATSLGITRKGVEWQVRQLREDGVLGRVGPAKGGYWEILK